MITRLRLYWCASAACNLNAILRARLDCVRVIGQLCQRDECSCSRSVQVSTQRSRRSAMLAVAAARDRLLWISSPVPCWRTGNV
eukprot:5678907-Prymnesium_polylepis.3